MIINTIIICALSIWIYMSILFIIAQVKKNNSIADIGWGLGFILIALISIIKTGLYLPRHLLTTTLVILWGTRISLYIAYRNWNKGEDPRYIQFRQRWGSLALLYGYCEVFLLQGLLLLIVASTIIIINCSTSPTINKFDIIGTLFWLVGFVFETVADIQLYNFLHNPANKGRIMKYGLWQYSRHPNYFGEVCVWWGIWAIALSVPYGLIGIVSPITITILILFVSGIPLAEKQLEHLPEFQEYKKSTSIFFPLPNYKKEKKE